VDVVKVKAVDAVMAPVPMQAHAPNPVATALPVRRIPMVVQRTPVVALVAINRAATDQSVVHAQPPLACRVMISSINRLRITVKMISNPVPMRIWVPKVV
jgi:hypothetical protein